MKRPVKSGIATLKALGFVVAVGAAAHASLPYLPLIGPPPLRVQVLKNPDATALGKIEALTASVPTNSLSALEAKVFPGTTNAMGGETVAAVSGPPTGADTDKSLVETYGDSVSALPTPDLLSITPQMLAIYFRPVQFGTNSPALAGPFHVGFMPPQPMPENSSRAEYIVK